VVGKNEKNFPKEKIVFTITFSFRQLTLSFSVIVRKKRRGFGVFTPTKKFFPNRKEA